MGGYEGKGRYSDPRTQLRDRGYRLRDRDTRVNERVHTTVTRVCLRTTVYRATWSRVE